jgi:hypothetical protein
MLSNGLCPISDICCHELITLRRPVAARLLKHVFDIDAEHCPSSIRVEFDLASTIS